MKNWNEKRVLIIGAARQGLALARYLSGQGALVTLNDHRPPLQLQDAVQSMTGYAVNWVLGEHPLSLLDDTDLVCVSGGVPLTIPLIAAAQERGIPLSNDSQVFMQSVPCPVIGITGSAGKTTTTTLVGRMAEAAVNPYQRVWVGGNIGLPLVDHLDEIGEQDVVVLELSSFQLELMTVSPAVAAILNITPNHLDRHGTFEAYAAAKARILTGQGEYDAAVLNRDDPAAWALSNQIRGRLVSFGLHKPDDGLVGTYCEHDRLMLVTPDGLEEIMPVSEIRLRGKHNRLNVLAACAIAYAAGFPTAAMRAGVANFGGVAHRLEFVRTVNGAHWYNDSIATAPERTIAAIRSFDEPLVLLLGGRDKNLPWEPLLDLVRERVDHVVLFGEAAEMIARNIGWSSDGPTVTRCGGLEEAVKAAAAVAEPGDVVLLSPGGTSYDEFIDFEQRGERFRQWVERLS